MICTKCKYFIGMDAKGYVYCAKFKRFMHPMIICKFFEPLEELQKQQKGSESQ